MKRKLLQQICSSHTKELRSQFDILKEKYPYIFKFEDIFDNLSSRNISILKTIITNSSLNNTVKEYVLQLLGEDAKDPIVIGITGTVGKTSTSYILSEYLKALGKKVTLLSSASIDLPISKINKNICMPVPIKSSNYLKNFLQLSLDYNSEYIIIEVSEEALRDNRVQYIPFDIKILTHFWHNWMEGELSDKDYLNNKLSFFTNEADVKYFYNVSSERLSQFIFRGNNPILYGSKENANGVSGKDITYPIEEFFATLTKQYIEIQTPTKTISLRTKYAYNYAATQNICGVVSVLDYLNILNVELLENVLNSYQVPGRKTITINNRTIVITQNYLNDIRHFKDLLENEKNATALEKIGESFMNTYNNIIVVDGVSGWHPSWENMEQSEEDFFNRLSLRYPIYFNSKSKAFELVDKYYVTHVNPGLCNKDKLINYIENVLVQSNKPVTKIPDRKTCIRQAILDSQPGDIIFISGRASFDLYLDGEEALFFTDEEVINKFMEVLQW